MLVYAQDMLVYAWLATRIQGHPFIVLAVMRSSLSSHFKITNLDIPGCRVHRISPTTDLANSSCTTKLHHFIPIQPASLLVASYKLMSYRKVMESNIQDSRDNKTLGHNSAGSKAWEYQKLQTPMMQRLKKMGNTTDGSSWGDAMQTPQREYANCVVGT
ncbi:hypothetical protein FPOAC2_02337 [Fusarium poae]|jgi:hypothetical protein